MKYIVKTVHALLLFGLGAGAGQASQCGLASTLNDGSYGPCAPQTFQGVPPGEFFHAHNMPRMPRITHPAHPLTTMPRALLRGARAPGAFHTSSKLLTPQDVRNHHISNKHERGYSKRSSSHVPNDQIVRAPQSSQSPYAFKVQQLLKYSLDPSVLYHALTIKKIAYPQSFSHIPEEYLDDAFIRAKAQSHLHTFLKSERTNFDFGILFHNVSHANLQNAILKMWDADLPFQKNLSEEHAHLMMRYAKDIFSNDLSKYAYIHNMLIKSLNHLKSKDFSVSNAQPGDLKAQDAKTFSSIQMPVPKRPQVIPDFFAKFSTQALR